VLKLENTSKPSQTVFSDEKNHKENIIFTSLEAKGFTELVLVSEQKSF
jgi:hypothetical protein